MEVYRCRKCCQNLEVQNSVIRNFACQHGNLKWPEQSVQSTNQNHPNSDPTNQNSDNYQPQTTDGFTPYGMAHNGSHWGQHTSQYQNRHPSGNRGQQHKADDNKDSLSQPKQKQAGGGVGGLFSHKKEMKLPDDKEPSIVWDPVKKRWVDTDGAREEEKPAAPPLTDHELKGQHGNLKWPEQSVQSTNQNHPNSDPTNQNSDNYQPQTTDGFTPYGMAHNGSHWGQHTSQYQTTQCFHPYLNLRDSQSSAVSAESAKRSSLASTSSFSQDAGWEEGDDQVDTAGTHEAAPSIFDIQPTQQKIIAPKLRKRTFSETSTGSERDRHPSGNRGQQHKAGDNKDSLSQQKQKQAGGGVGGLFSHKKELKLPDDKEPSIVWDPVKKRWVDKDGAGEEEKPAAPPPTDHELKGCNDVNSSQSSVVYLDVDLCPEWIVQSFEQASWIKGKLLCIKCKGRLGSFDFVNQKVCRCKQHTVPVVHLLSNRIDQVQKRQSISPVFPLVQYRDVQMRSTANGCSNPDDSISGTVVSANNNEKSNTKTDHEHEGRDNIINRVQTEPSERNSIILHDEYTPQNCCGQVDLFSDLGEAFVEEFRSVNDNLSEANVSDYNVFDVLSVIEDEPDDLREGKQTMEGQETHKEIQDIPTELTCAVCLEIFYRAHRCDPCNHIFCEHCLRQVCKQTPTLTPCPLCREVIRKCVFQNDLTEVISTEHEQLYKERHHEVRKQRKDKYPLPSCTASQHMRYLRERRQHGGATQWTYREEQNFIIRGCLQEILVRLAWLLLIFLVHNILFRLDNWLMWDVNTPISDNFNSFLLTLTCKLLLFGIIYCVKKCFCINMESQFMGQAVLFVFIFSVLWDSNSWIQFMLNMVVLGSLFL